MSYAAVAAHNAPPPEAQPRPDPALLNTTPPQHAPIADDSVKVNIVAPDFKEHPHTYFAETVHEVSEEDYPEYQEKKPTPGAHENNPLDTVKHYLIRPGVAGGLIGLVNIGLLASVGRAFYIRPHLRRDATVLSSVAAAAIALFSMEGYAAEKYRKTPRGRAEERRAKKEGALIFRHLHEQILRPEVLGGLVGIVNTGILAALGYVSYKNWNTTWDRRTVSAISVGLLTLWGGEGVLAEKYVDKRTRK